MNWRFWQRQQSTNEDVPTTGTDAELPEEVREYYESSRRNQTSRSLLLGIGTLFATLAIAALLFFGGRFVYRQFNNDEVAQTPTVSETEVDLDTPANEPADEPALPGDNNDEEADPTPADDSENEENDRPARRSNGSTTPRSGDLPNSGPGDMLAIFVGTVLINAAGYHLLAPRVNSVRK